jgi:hypothetical protein
MMMTVRKSSIFPASVEEIYDKLVKLETLQHIAYPYATFEPVNGENELLWAKCFYGHRQRKWKRLLKK